MAAAIATTAQPIVSMYFGSISSIFGPPATTSHVECTREEREAMGIPENLIRYSVGIEDPQDLIADLEQALEHYPVTA